MSKDKPTRKPNQFQKCMSRELKGEMKGKGEAARKRIFKKAAELCASK